MTDETKPLALNKADKQAEAWAERQAVQIERAIQIIVSASTTVLAGFLSRVWGSASILLRKELANDLHAMGVLFTTTFSLTAMRMGVEIYKDKPQPNLNKPLFSLRLSAYQ